MKQQLSHIPGPIGVFDSGYGGLTILEKIREVLPEYDYIWEIMPVLLMVPVLLRLYMSLPCKQSINYLRWVAI